MHSRWVIRRSSIGPTAPGMHLSSTLSWRSIQRTHSSPRGCSPPSGVGACWSRNGERSRRQRLRGCWLHPPSLPMSATSRSVRWQKSERHACGGLPSPTSELGSTRVRHYRVAEVGYIRLGWGREQTEYAARSGSASTRTAANAAGDRVDRPAPISWLLRPPQACLGSSSRQTPPLALAAPRP